MTKFLDIIIYAYANIHFLTISIFDVFVNCNLETVHYQMQQDFDDRII